ncbi:hypothetical protein F5887DRAFT_1288843 [Amanita rubescens]|nr:hypothetical protein F5887DRAFT_1288843 [Amanita rubescens]
MVSHLLTALGPGAQLGSLSRFTPDYLAARKALRELLVFPNLDTISFGDVLDSTTNLFALVSSGNSRLSDMTNINVDLARKVISYDAALSTLLDSIPVQLLVMTMQPVATGYTDQSRAGSETNQRFFSSFSQYVETINDRAADLQVKLNDLDTQIQEQSEALAQRNIIATLWEVLKTLYSLSSSAEESDVQIAALLGVTSQILSALQALRDQISLLRTKLVALSKGLTVVITNSQQLLNVWDDIAARQGTVAGVTEMVPPTDSGRLMHAVRSTQFNANPKVPITKHEICLYKMVAALGGRAPVFSPHGNLRSRIAAALKDDDNVIEKVIGPPLDTQEKLEDLADSTGKIIDQFNTLLQTPYLDQILCTSPIDGSDSNLYISLEIFAAYAVLQQTLLPFVKRDDQANTAAGDISLSMYLATNTPLVSEYVKSATELSKRSTEVKNDWDNAINLVKMKINECDFNIGKWQRSIDDLTEEQKNMTMHACLFAFGAFLAFTAAVFLPGVGMLLALAVGAVLGGLAVREAIGSSQITEAINDLKASIQVAQETKRKLEALLTPMQEIAQNLSKVSLIWSDITTALTKLDTFYKVLNGPTGPSILDFVKPQVIIQWGVVNTSVQDYINTVAK